MVIRSRLQLDLVTSNVPASAALNSHQQAPVYTQFLEIQHESIQRATQKYLMNNPRISIEG
jgi:hypothetical protein